MSTELTPNDIKTATLREIARIIIADWKNVHFAAKPYLDAMLTLDTLRDNYGWDTGLSIVTYFLGNASTWRGDTAKLVKKELNRRIR